MKHWIYRQLTFFRDQDLVQGRLLYFIDWLREVFNPWEEK